MGWRQGCWTCACESSATAACCLQFTFFGNWGASKAGHNDSFDLHRFANANTHPDGDTNTFGFTDREQYVRNSLPDDESHRNRGQSAAHLGTR